MSWPRLHQLPSYPLTGVSPSSTFLPSHRGFLPSNRGFSILNNPTLSQGFLHPQHSYPLTRVLARASTNSPPTLSQGFLSPQVSYPLTGVSPSSTFIPSHRGFFATATPTPLLPSHRGFSLLKSPTLSQGFLPPQHSYPLTGVSLPRLHQLPSYPLTGVSLSSTFRPSHRGFSLLNIPTLSQGFLSPQHSYPLTGVSLSSTFLPSHRCFSCLHQIPTYPLTGVSGPRLHQLPSYPLTGVSLSSTFLPSHRGFSLLNIHTLSQGFLGHGYTNSPPTLSQGFLSPQHSYPLTGVSLASTKSPPTLSQGFLARFSTNPPPPQHPPLANSGPRLDQQPSSTFLPSHRAFLPFPLILCLIV